MIDFEKFLQESYIEEEEHSLDNDISDGFNDWLTCLDIDELIERADSYGELMFERGKIKILDDIKKDLK